MLVQNTEKSRENDATAPVAKQGSYSAAGGTTEVRINRLPAITWHRLRVNDKVVRLPEAGSARRAELRMERAERTGGAEGSVSDQGGTAVFGAEQPACKPAPDLSDLRTGAGEAFSDWVAKTGIEAVRLRSGAEEGEIVRMHIEPAAAATVPALPAAEKPEKPEAAEAEKPIQAFVLPVQIEAQEGQELSVIMDFTDPKGKPESRLLAVRTGIRAGRGSLVRLVQLQMTGERTEVISDIGAEVGDNARVEIVQLFVGGAGLLAGAHGALDGDQKHLSGAGVGAACVNTYAASEINLRGAGSRSETYVGYLGAGTGKLDFNYNAVHRGQNTDSKMTVNGVLRDSAEKTFRGTIDFKTGSSGAVGAETEEVLLLGQNIVNKTIPLILCAEEDVKGSHGASIGQLDEEMLFYLASRGISEEKAVDLMAGARIGSIIGKIGDARAERKVAEFLGMETE